MRASVIIPSYNAKDRLYYNLTALNQQSYDGEDIEVIVIDNGSVDNTMEMLQEFKLKYPMKIIRVEENRGIAFGRNMGITNASGDILIFHDSDMIADKDFIRLHLDAHESPNMVVCGLFWRRIFTYYYSKFNKSQIENFERIRESLGLGRLSLYWDGYPLLSEEQIKEKDLSKYSYDLDFGFITDLREIVREYGRDFKSYYLPWRFFITNNLSVERKRVIEVGMFDPNIIRYGYEDYDLGIRLYKSGSRFIMADNIISLHQEHPPNYQPDDLVVNINYICDKYNSIYFIDVVLVCMSDYLYLDKKMMNGIAGDINKVLPREKYHPILQLFLELLQIMRRRYFCPEKDNGNEYFQTIAPRIGEYVNMVLDLNKSLRCEFFIRALNSLFKKTFDVDFERIVKVNSERRRNPA